MPSYLTVILIIVLALILAVTGLMLLIWRKISKPREDNGLQLLQQQFLTAAGQQDSRMAQVSEQLSGAMQNLTANLQAQIAQTNLLSQQTQQALAQRLDAAGKTIGDLKGQLGQLAQATQNIIQVGTDVRQLQNILQSPKLRGGMGEWSLEMLLAEVLPPQHFTIQHRFANGTIVDALVRLANGSIGVDAKFPLSNFQAMLEAADDATRQKARRQFRRDVCKRIDEIAQKYILPEEGTLDFALMYVPAENVYYEAMTTDGDLDVGAYGRQCRVIPVSPNTLYAYLMVIAVGLKGLQIEKNAQLIRQRLTQFAGEISQFENDFALVGKHITNAAAKHSEAGKKLERFVFRLQQLEQESPSAVLETTSAKALEKVN